MIETYLAAIIIGLVIVIFLFLGKRKTSNTVVHNTYNYGDNIENQMPDAIIQRSFNKEVNNSHPIASVQLDSTADDTKSDAYSISENILNYKNVYSYLEKIADYGCKSNLHLDMNSDKPSRKSLRENGLLVTYGDILKKFGKRSDYQPHQRELFAILDEINDSTKPILLSALVVTGDNFLPGKLFFKKWMKNINLNNKEECLEGWAEEIYNIWDSYCEKIDDENICQSNSCSTAPKSADFERKLLSLLAKAEEEGKEYLDVRSGYLHEIVGGYENSNHRMPACCNVMKKLMKNGDKVLQEPPSGYGAYVVIRYYLPR